MRIESLLAKEQTQFENENAAKANGEFLLEKLKVFHPRRPTRTSELRSHRANIFRFKLLCFAVLAGKKV